MAGSSNSRKIEREVFIAALDLEIGKEQDTFLEQACRGDTALEERIRHLLEVTKEEGSFLDSELMADEIFPAGSVLEAKEGTSFGEYELIKHIASGAMGVVWRARQKSLDRDVALKVLRQSWIAGKEEWERFRNEAQVAAGLIHPNIVTVYEFGEVEGQPYLTMPFIEGETLSKKMGEFQSDRRRLVSFFVKIVDAVDAAHRMGILHRDLKPGNILIDGEGEPHVTDFGIAKRQIDDANLTLSGQVMGTPYYMAPEQARGETRNSTPAMDVFSLGVIFYELISGVRPFDGDSVVSLIRQVTEEKEIRLRMRDPSIDGDLEAITEKCLEKVPGNRYQTAAALSADLRCWLERRPVSVKPTTPLQRLGKWGIRKPVHASLAGLSLLFLFTLAVAGPLVARHQAELNRELAERSQILARNSYRTGIAAALDALEKPAVTERVLDMTERLRPENGEADLRGWEWDFLRSAVSQSEETYPVKTHTYSQISVDPGGKKFAIPSFGKVVVFDREFGGVSEAFSISDQMLLSGAAWGPKTERIVVASKQGAIRMFSGAREVWKNALAGEGAQKSDVWFVAWNSSGSEIAAGNSQGTVFVLDPVSGEQVDSWTSHSKRLQGLEWSPDGNELLTFSNDNKIKIWKKNDRSNGASRTIPVGEKMHAAQWSPDGEMVGVVSESSLSIFESATGNLISRKSGVHGERSLAWHPTSKFFATGGLDEVIRLWSIGNESDRPIRTLFGHTGEILALAWSATEPRIYSLARDDTLRIWDTHNLGARFSFHIKGEVFALSWHPKGDKLAVSGQSKEISIMIRGSRRIAKTFKSPAGLVRYMAWSPQGGFLASSQADNTIVVWPVFSRNERRVRGPFSAPRKGLLWSSTERLMHWGGTGIAGGDHPVKLKGIEGSGMLRLLDENPKFRKLAGVREKENDIVLIEPDTGMVLGHWSVGSSPILDLSWSHDGKFLVAGNREGNLSIWNVASQERVGLLIGHTGPVRSVAWHPTEGRIASGSDDRTVRLWNASNGEELLVLREHEAVVRAVAWDPRGEILASGDEAGVVWSRSSEGNEAVVTEPTALDE